MFFSCFCTLTGKETRFGLVPYLSVFFDFPWFKQAEFYLFFRKLIGNLPQVAGGCNPGFAEDSGRDRGEGEREELEEHQPLQYAPGRRL